MHEHNLSKSFREQFFLFDTKNEQVKRVIPTLDLLRHFSKFKQKEQTEIYKLITITQRGRNVTPRFFVIVFLF